MPDLAVCNSTVCSVRTQCMRNWDSKAYKPDRDPKIQRWVPREVTFGVGHDANARAEDCSWYKPMHHFPQAPFELTMEEA